MRFSRKLSFRCLLLATIILVVAPVGDLAAGDWPQWRGPNRDGTTSAELPDPWPQQLSPLWRVALGAGHAGPVIVGDRVVSFFRQDDDEVVACLAAETGEQLWRTAYPAPYTPAAAAKAHGQGPFATPAVSDGKVYTLGISGQLSCFDMSNGKQLWQRDFSQYSPGYPEWGASSSPLVTGKHCIAMVGGKAGGALVACNRDSGEEAWKFPLPEGPAYASPLVATVAGKPMLLVLTRNRVLGLAPDAGTLLWQQEFTTGYEQNSVDPLAVGKTLLLSGFRRGTTAVELGGKQGPRQLWHNDKVSGYMSSPVRHGDHIYILSQERSGRLQCLAVTDGALAWISEEKIGEYASVVRTGDRLLVLKTDGELLVIAADPAAYKLLGRSQLSKETVWAHLALTSARLLVKDKSHLTAFALAASVDQGK